MKSSTEKMIKSPKVKKGAKRDDSSRLRKLLKYDVYFTYKFCLFANHFLPLRTLKPYYAMLEVSCHGIPWICGLLTLIWILDNKNLYQMQINLLMGIFLDIVLVAALKARIRRRRPASNRADMITVVGPDNISFPSGHASRACFVAHFFIHLWPVSFLIVMPLLVWSTAVCISQVLLQRQHLLDVLAGALLGRLEGIIIGWLWLSQDTSSWLVSCMSDERLEGGSYHV